MKENKKLQINGTMLEKEQLKKHLEKIASSHNIINKSQKDTYPVPEQIKDYEIIKEEWLLDNFYIIEETVKQIEKELTLKKYINFVGIANGEYAGYARIYVLASEIVAYTDNKIEKENLEEYLQSYQNKKTLNMDEIWNIGTFIQIAIIHNIAQISEKIASNQAQKYKVESIVERLIDGKTKQEQIYKEYKEKTHNFNKVMLKDMRYPFIEYMSYTLKRYGKKGTRYLKVLEEIVEKTRNDSFRSNTKRTF